MKVIKPKFCPPIPLIFVGKCEEIKDFFIVGNHYGFLAKMKNKDFLEFVLICRIGKKTIKAHYIGAINQNVPLAKFLKYKNKYSELIK